MIQLRRRQFLIASGALLAAPLARAQTKAMRLGLLANVLPPLPVIMDPLAAGLRSRGWVEGPNFVIERRGHAGDPAKALEMAKELAGLRVDAILALSTLSAVAAKQASETIPVVTWVGDPVAAGLAQSLARPGGNFTGVANYASAEVWGKLVELLREVRPSLQELAILWDFVLPGFPDGPAMLDTLQGAAKKLGVGSQIFMVHNEQELLAALSTIDRRKFDGLVVSATGGVHSRRALSARIAEVVTRRRLPAITDLAASTFANAGCLLAYSPQVAALVDRLAYFIDKVLRGTKPGELPFEQPARFELAINLKTAKALGLTVPQSLLVRADRVIE
jgi:putative ABC transport system substrate-binding protein